MSSRDFTLVGLSGGLLFPMEPSVPAAFMSYPLPTILYRAIYPQPPGWILYPLFHFDSCM